MKLHKIDKTLYLDINEIAALDMDNINTTAIYLKAGVKLYTFQPIEKVLKELEDIKKEEAI